MMFTEALKVKAVGIISFKKEIPRVSLFLCRKERKSGKVKKYFKNLLLKHLHVSKKSSNFAPDFNNNIMSNPFI